MLGIVAMALLPASSAIGALRLKLDYQLIEPAPMSNAQVEGDPALRSPDHDTLSGFGRSDLYRRLEDARTRAAVIEEEQRTLDQAIRTRENLLDKLKQLTRTQSQTLSLAEQQIRTYKDRLNIPGEAKPGVDSARNAPLSLPQRPDVDQSVSTSTKIVDGTPRVSAVPARRSDPEVSTGELDGAPSQTAETGLEANSIQEPVVNTAEQPFATQPGRARTVPGSTGGAPTRRTRVTEPSSVVDQLWGPWTWIIGVLSLLILLAASVYYKRRSRNHAPAMSEHDPRRAPSKGAPEFGIGDGVLRTVKPSAASVAAGNALIAKVRARASDSVKPSRGRDPLQDLQSKEFELDAAVALDAATETSPSSDYDLEALGKNDREQPSAVADGTTGRQDLAEDLTALSAMPGNGPGKEPGSATFEPGESVDLAIRKIDTLIAFERYEQAEQVLNALLTKEPNNSELRIRQLHIRSVTGDDAKAADEEAMLAALMGGRPSDVTSTGPVDKPDPSLAGDTQLSASVDEAFAEDLPQTDELRLEDPLSFADPLEQVDSNQVSSDDALEPMLAELNDALDSELDEILASTNTPDTAVGADEDWSLSLEVSPEDEPTRGGLRKLTENSALDDEIVLDTVLLDLEDHGLDIQIDADEPPTIELSASESPELEAGHDSDDYELDQLLDKHANQARKAR